MTSWYSQLLTTTTTRISNLRTTLLQGEADGDTEDDTHVCRVLRNYYTEKGRPFPGWLPPDPKAPPPPQPVFTNSSSVGSRYGGLVAGNPGSAGSGASSSSNSGLSSLWDRNAAGGAGARQDQASLRAGRGVPPPLRGADVPSSRNPFANARSGEGRSDVQARPLPSQRAGSYQQTSAGAYGRETTTTPPPGNSSSSAASAQDRLKQRLWGSGAKTTSPPQSNPYRPPPPSSQQQGSGRYGSGGGSGGFDSYEDRFAPGGMYDAAEGSSRGGGSDRPFMAANAPWASNETDYSGGYSAGGGGGGGRSGGLPSGPRRGLPSGPRMR